MLKHFKNRGSALVMVVIFFSIVSMLGMTMLYLGYTNYKLKILDQRAKTVFYLAEAGQDEAHALIINEVKNAIEYGYSEVDSLNQKNSPLSIERFENGYMTYIQNNMIKSIETHRYSILSEEFGRAPQITITRVQGFTDNQKKLIFELDSSYELNHINKTIKVLYKISVPSYSESLLQRDMILNQVEYEYITT